MKRNDTGIATKSIIDAVIDPVTWGEAVVLCVLAALGFGFLAFLCVLGGAGREVALAYFGGCVRCGAASAIIVAITHGFIVAWRRNSANPYGIRRGRDR